MGNQLVDFIRSRKEKSAGAEIDWNAKKDAWVLAVEGLYHYVKEMLNDSIASNDISIKTTEMEISEDFIGPYCIPRLELTIGSERIELLPKGLTVIGASGRVDIRGYRDTVSLLLDNKDSSKGWSLIVQRLPHLKTVPLDSESLKFAFERVMLP